MNPQVGCFVVKGFSGLGAWVLQVLRDLWVLDQNVRFRQRPYKTYIGSLWQILSVAHFTAEAAQAAVSLVEVRLHTGRRLERGGC